MHLTDKELENRVQWEKAGIELPRFDRQKMIAATKAAPEWVHFGAGNIFRIYPAALQQTLLDEGIGQTGIIIVAGRDGEVIEKAFDPCDNLTLGVTLKADGTIAKKVIASAAYSLWMGKQEDFAELKRIFRSPSLMMASLTITEKGYSLLDGKGETLADVSADFSFGPESGIPRHYLGKIAALLYERYKVGRDKTPLHLSMVSFDNSSHNGDKLFAVMESFAKAWTEKGFVEKGFLDYLRDRKTIGFPYSIIDKIVPSPDETIKAMLEEIGFEDTEIHVTSRGTRIAPFVNAEETGYLVIEDTFPGGRPLLEKAGVYFTDRDTVNKVERMKLCTCLNPLQTAISIFGCLLGYTRVRDEMKNPHLVKLVEQIGYVEGFPVVTDPLIISPKEFIDQVIKVRLPNPFMPDTPQRTTTDSSLKIPIRYGETIKSYLRDSRLDVQNLKIIPLVLAAWVRYLMGIDDKGNPFTVSPDPLYPSLFPLIEGIKLGDTGPFHAQLEPIFSNSRIFGVNLYEAGLGEKVESYFAELVAGPGAVAATLEKYTGEASCRK